jgi:hypothetical protein
MTNSKLSVRIRIRTGPQHSHACTCSTRRLNGDPVRLRVRIGSQHSFACRKWQLNQAFLLMTPEKQTSRVTVNVAQ